jgi:transcriptional antiterminator
MNKALSTFEREMQNPAFKKAFEVGYQELLLSELLMALVEKDKKSVRELAKEVNLSPNTIQKMRSGKQDDIKMSNFINISHACGYKIILEKDDERISL